MKANDKIYVAEYLKFLNENVNWALTYHHISKDSVVFLNCKTLAEKCEVTPATITNLTTSSKFYLLHRIAQEILDSYYGFFEWDERENRKEYPDEVIYPRDVNYVLMYLTTYYSDEFLR